MGLRPRGTRVKGIDRITIKWVAMISMFIDHFAYALVHKETLAGEIIRTSCSTIGRMAFPLFVYLLVDFVLVKPSTRR